MRIWHYKLLPYLPDKQFKGQLRELVAIMRTWRDKGSTNHLLINKVMEYRKNELEGYFMSYAQEYNIRYKKLLKERYYVEFILFGYPDVELANTYDLFAGWHNEEYLRICMANLYEKYAYAKGKSKITDEEWTKLKEGYKEITGEEYYI